MTRLARLLGAACVLACQGCVAQGSATGGAVDPPASPKAVRIVIAGPNAVSLWNDVATATINQPANPAGTPSERVPIGAMDLATVQVAVYDAVMAIRRTHRPFAVSPHADVDGASPEAAAGEAAYGVLKGLFPSRMAAVEPIHERFLASLPDGRAKSLGRAVGAEVAAAVVVLRANDGRLAVLPPYVPGSAPGQYRGTQPIGQVVPLLRPLALASNMQFMASGPPPLASAAYAADFNETRLLGAAASTSRTPQQTEAVRFHTESPAAFWPRNIRAFAMTGKDIGEHARLLAMIWVTQADAIDTCFASKYHFQRWRPQTAIALADTDGNEATAADATWTPVVPTPPDPEYPAAHTCLSGALAQALQDYYGTPDVTFDFTSTATGTTHHFTSVDALVADTVIARIAGGMHFRSSAVDGAALGRAVARWELANNFQPR